MDDAHLVAEGVAADVAFPPSEKLAPADVAAWATGEKLPQIEASAQVIEEVGAEDATEFTHTFDRLPHTDPDVALLVRIEISQDGGKTWVVEGFYATTGGYFPAEEGDESASKDEQVWSVDMQNWALFDGDLMVGAVLKPRRTQGYYTHSRTEGFYSEDGGKSWQSMIGLEPKRYAELASRTDIVYEKRDVVYPAGYLLRKVVVVKGNKEAAQVSLQTAVKT